MDVTIGFGAKRAAELAGVPKGTLDYHLRRGYLHLPNHVQGRKKTLHMADVEAIRKYFGKAADEQRSGTAS